jgi:hypothetical protein
MKASPQRRRPVTTEADLSAADDTLPEEVGPFRRCIVTRERLPKERMIRFVIGPGHTLVPDVAARLPGRGMWLSARGDVLEAARTRDAFARAARSPVRAPQDLADRVRAGIIQRIEELLGLARRAGQAVAGFDRAREWVRSGRVGLILQASDGSTEERRRFLGGIEAGRTGMAVLAPLPAARLGAVFGRDRAVHVAVAPGKLAELLTQEVGRLSGLGLPGAASVPPDTRVERSGAARHLGEDQAGQ